MDIKPLTTKDIQQAALLHFKELPDITTTLGLPYVTRMYQLFVTDLVTHFCLGAWEKDELIGIIIVSTDMNKTHKIFHKLFSFATAVNLFLKIITFTISPMRILNRFLFEKKLEKITTENYCCLGPICVNDAYQGRGIGKLLLKKAIEHIRKKRITMLYVYTRFDNKNAIAFYKKCGFIVADSFYEGTLLTYSIKK